MVHDAAKVRWETLPDGAFTPGHPIFFIEWGEADPSEACPGG